ncbi:MAG: biotin--[acetyl-CoA-carboxylase] ligase [Proteobacteria bacterium]|nr:biotin--[acetyl-CoA-carboxylase] ligase [Pseudomonadota bacterium]
MANHEHKSLNLLYQLYQFLLENPVQYLSDLEAKLGVPKQDLISHFKTLESMGLGFFHSNEKIELNHSIDAINLKSLQEKLTLKNIEIPIHYSFTTTSTNQLASNNKVPSIYITDSQSKGKGRQNKTWVTPLGQSIAISISHAFNCGLSEISGLNIAIGVAIMNTIEQLGDKEIEGIGLKWPNDVIGEKGKIAGILIEASGNNKSCFVVIGIGLNWNVRQSILDKVDRKCTNLWLKGVSRTQFLAALIINVELLIQEFSQNKLKNIVPVWKEYDCYKGKIINVIQDKTVKPAKYIGINSQGYLSVEMQGRTKLLASGEVTPYVTIRKAEDKS